MSQLAPALMIVLDGAADDLLDGRTALERAELPNLDQLARSGHCGLIHPIGPGIAPESHSGLVNLLGFQVHPADIPRGPIEALGAGLELEVGDLALRVNFGTGDPVTGRIADRRMCRELTDQDTASLCALLNKDLRITPPFDDCEAAAEFLAVREYRAVLRIRSKHELSENVSNSDPGYPTEAGQYRVPPDEGYTLLPVRPTTDDDAAVRTAAVLNNLVHAARSILSNAPVNLDLRRRDLPEANMLLTRGPGIARPSPAEGRAGSRRSTVIIADHPIEAGVAKHVGAELAAYSPGDYQGLVRTALEQVSRPDRPHLVMVHLKGPDEFGHDRDVLGKASSLTLIDREVIAPLSKAFLESGYRMIVTSDHATPCRLGVHTADPVPFVFAGPGVTPVPASAFDERSMKECNPQLGSQLLKLAGNLPMTF